MLVLLIALVAPHHHEPGDDHQVVCPVCQLFHGGMDLAAEWSIPQGPRPSSDRLPDLCSLFEPSVDRHQTGSPRAPPAS
jgi:hypothetical protein